MIPPPARPQPPPAILHPTLQVPLLQPSSNGAGLPPQPPPAASPHSGYGSALRSPPPPISSPLSGFPQPAYPAMRAAPGMRPIPKPVSAPPSHSGSSPPLPPPPGMLPIPGASPSPSPSPASAPFRAPPPPFNPNNPSNPFQLQYPPPVTPHFSPPLVHSHSVPASAAASAYPSSSPSPASATSQPQQFSPSLGSFNPASRRSPSISTGGPSPLISPLMSPHLPPPLQTFLPSPTHPAAHPTPVPAASPMQRTVSSPPASSPTPATPVVPPPQQQHGAAPAPASPPSSGGATRSRASHLPHIQALHLADSTRDYPIMSPTQQHNRTPSQTSQSSRHVSPAVAPITFTLTPCEDPLDASHYQEPAVVHALDHHTIDGGDDGGDDGEQQQDDGHEEDHSEHEEVDDPPTHFDPTDMLGRLCSSEKIKADDLPFWRNVMEGMEWAFFDAQAPEVQKLIEQYCRSFVATAARSRNLHAMLLVICRHLENYSQHLHQVSAASAATNGSTASSSPHASSGSLLTKDHKWVMSLLFFLRVVVQYVLTHLAYEDTLRFFAHLAVPDAASKPNTPKTAIPSYSNQGSWSSNLSVPASAYRSRSPSPNSPRGTISGLATPPSHVAINLNPNSRRSSLNSQTDVLTRFVCAIVNSLEVLGDAKLNQEIAATKSSSSAASASDRSSAKPMASPSHAALAAAAAASASTSPSPPSGKGSQPVIDLHLELLNTFFVLLSTQMYLPLSTEFEQVFLDRLMYCCKPPMLNSMQGFVTALISAFTEILPADYATTVFQRASQNASASSAASSSSTSAVGGFFSKITSKLSTLFYFPVWAVRYLFSIPPNHPLIDRSTLLLELLVYQNNDNVFRDAVRKLRDADPPAPSQVNISRSASGNSTIIAAGVTPLMPSQLSAGSIGLSDGANITGPDDLSALSMLDKFEAGAISYSKLYYSLCSTLLSEHINLFLYSLIHENAGFRRYILTHHTHDLDYLLMPQLEILYREVDISKHHVYMIINIWILLTQHHGFDAIIKSIRIKEVPFFKEMPLKDLQLTHVMQIVLLRTLQLNLRTKLKEPHIFNNCFPEDHQIMTEQGFMFLAQVEEALQHQKQLRIACYDEATKQLQYHAITAADLVVKHGSHRMVDVICTPDGTQKRNVRGYAKSAQPSNHVSLSVTADHDLYVRFGQKTVWRAGGFNKVKAGELLTTNFPRFKMLAAATGGVELQQLQPQSDSTVAESAAASSSVAASSSSAAASAASTLPSPSAPFVTALDLTQPWHVAAFLELYGYWLDDGTLSFINAAIVFSPSKEADDIYLDRWFAALPLHALPSGGAGKLGYWRQPTRSGGRRLYMIYHPAWWSFFSGEYARKYVHAARDYAKAFSHPPGQSAPPPPVAAKLDALPAMRAAPSSAASSAPSPFDHVTQLSAQLASGRLVQSPFAHLLLGGDISNAAPLRGARVRVMVNLLNPVHSHFGADQTGREWSVAFRLLNLALLSSGCMPTDAEAGVAITQLIPLVSSPIECEQLGSSELYSPVWQASMEATLQSGASVVVAAGEHVQARWRETPLITERVQLELPGVQTTCCSARSSLDGAPVFIVSCQHPSALDDSTLPSLTAALALARALVLANGASLSAAALQDVAACERVVNTAPSSKSSKWFWWWVWRRGVLQPEQLRLIVRGLRLAQKQPRKKAKQSDGKGGLSVDGVELPKGTHAGGTLFTSSTLFRDELMIVLLHAGYAAYFTKTYDAGSSHGWTICYSDQPRATEPSMHVSRDVRERQLQGRVWCVTVPHKDHLIVVRRAQTDDKGMIVEASRPVIVGNCLAAFCNLTITALIGPGPTGATPGSTPLVSPASAASGGPGSASPGSAGLGGSVLSVPLTLHPQVSFRLVRVLCILSRKFLSLQMLHESQIADHNARVELMAAEDREEVTSDEEREEIELEEVAEELGTCMEFIQLLLEVVNHAIVHSMPTPHPLAPPSQVAAFAAKAASSSSDSPLTSLSSNPHLLYHLLHAKEYFEQLLPYAHLFENNLISNLTNTVAFYEQAPGIVMPLAAAAGGVGMARSVAAAAKVSDKALEKVVSALRTAIGRTPMNNAGAHYSSPGHSPSGSSDAGAPVRKVSHALPPGSCPSFDPTALIERGPFTYHEQENSQDFFIPYIYQLAQTMKILPRMYAAPAADDAASAHGGGDSAQQAAVHATASALGDVDADVEFIKELEAEEAAAAAAAAAHNGEHTQANDDDQYDEDQEEDGFGGLMPAAAPVVEVEDNSKVRVAIV